MVSFQFRTSPSWRERSDRRIWWRGAIIRHSSGCFVTRKLIPPAWIYDQVHPGGSAATEGSGGGEQSSTTPPDASSLASSFLQHGFLLARGQGLPFCQREKCSGQATSDIGRCIG
ncbi:MAG: hypothetical protein FWF18_00865 [Dehalococcoidia bacterium]|nr:hypothetical protein [Dehalococcoidia bacterium]